MAATSTSLTDFSMGHALDLGPQLLCFKIHCLICAKAAPRQWLRRGWGGRLYREDPFPGDMVLYCHPTLAQSPQQPCCIFLRLHGSLQCFNPNFSLSLSHLGSDLHYGQTDLPGFFFFNSLPISFYPCISPNKILACLVLSSHLLLRGPGLIQDGIKFPSSSMR